MNDTSSRLSQMETSVYIFDVQWHLLALTYFLAYIRWDNELCDVVVSCASVEGVVPGVDFSCNSDWPHCPPCSWVSPSRIVVARRMERQVTRVGGPGRRSALCSALAGRDPGRLQGRPQADFQAGLDPLQCQSVSHNHTPTKNGAHNC